MSKALDRGGLLPTLTVEVDVTNQPTNPTRSWTDITGYVRLLSFTRSGRNDEFQRTTPGTLQMTLNNRDDAATRLETLGLAKAQWVRVSATWQSVTYRLWEGVIEELLRRWPSAGKDATIEVVAADSLKLCRLYDLAGTTFPAQRVDQRVVEILAAVGFPVGYANAVNAFLPSLYWRFGEASGTVAADASGNGRSGTYGAGVTLGQTGAPAGDSDKAVACNNSATGTITAAYSPFTIGSKRTFMGWAKRTATTDADTIFGGATFTHLLQLQAGSNDVQFIPGNLLSSAWTGAWPGTGTFVHWALTYDDAACLAELFINGVSQGQRTAFSPGYIGGGDNLVVAGGNASAPFNGVLDEFAVFETILTARQIQAIYNAGTVAAAGTFDTDTDTVDAVTTPLSTNSDALSQLLALEGSDSGLVIANGDGSMTYQGRHWRLVNARTATGTFTDDGTAIRYKDTVEYQDDDSRLANTVNVTALGASTPVTVSDSASQAKYFARTNPSVDRSLLSSSSSLALSAAQYLLGRYKDPSPRIPTIQVDLMRASLRNVADTTKMLAAVNSQRFTFKRTTAAPVNKDGYIEQVGHTIDPQQPSWVTTIQLSPASAESAWVLGDSTYGVLGSTTGLAY